MPANYVLLQRIELNASAASVVFANIPQSGYTDLKIVASGRGTRSEVQSNWLVSFNGSTSNFTARYLEGTGGGTSSGSYARFIGAVPAANATASTFGSLELYIPNYLSNTNKSYSVDSVTENNATLAFVELVAGLWSDTSAINSITISSGSSDNILANSTFSLYGLAAVGTTPVIPKAAGGDSIYSDGTYWYHIFTSTGAFQANQALTCNYLVVAGGGGGGGGTFDGNGGGGAGGLRSTVTATGGGGTLESAISVAAGSYAITVGAGGAGGIAWGGVRAAGSQGGSSTFSTITSIGGGFGAVYPVGGGVTAGGNGGSGGGGSSNGGTASGGTGTSNQGYAGGGVTGSGPWAAGGGGGGAGAVGSAGNTASSSPSSTGGNGGSGVAVAITGSSITYAGGGGGSTGYGGQGTGGSSIGGAGTNSSSVGNAGKLATGSGGGGNGYQGYPAIGGNGGSGIVVIRYAV